MRRLSAALVAVGVLGGWAGRARAQDLTEEPAAPPPAKKHPDKVILEGGAVVTGEIVAEKRGESVTIRTEDGELNTVDWNVIAKIVHGKKTGKTAKADPEETATSTSGPTAKGVGVGVSSERVVHLKEPGSSATMLAIDGGFMYGTSTKTGTKLDIFGGGAALTLAMRFGSKFPGEEGGLWNGVGVDVFGNIYGAGVVTKGPFGGTQGAGMLLAGGGGALGWQLYNFGAMDAETFKQHGFGLFLAARVGFANSTIWAKGSNGESSTDAQYGPQITLSLPSYNFGTSSRSAFYLSGYVLPTGDFLFANIQIGGAFSL